MKNRIFFMLMILTTFIYGQERIEVPEPPEPSNFEFDFQNFPEMDAKEEKELLKNLKQDLRKELEVIKGFNKNKYFDFLRESQFKNLAVPFLIKREKETHEREKRIFELEVKTEALASKYESANKVEKERIKNELKQKISDLFIEKEEERKNQVAELEQELKELKNSLEIRQKNKNEIISRRLQEILNEDKYLDWD